MKASTFILVVVSLFTATTAQASTYGHGSACNTLIGYSSSFLYRSDDSSYSVNGSSSLDIVCPMPTAFWNTSGSYARARVNDSDSTENISCSITVFSASWSYVDLSDTEVTSGSSGAQTLTFSGLSVGSASYGVMYCSLPSKKSGVEASGIHGYAFD